MLAGMAAIAAGEARAGTTVEFDDRSGLFRIGYNSATLVKAQYVFFRGNWQWVGLTHKNSAEQAGEFGLLGIDANNDFRLKGTAKTTAPDEMVWTLDFSEGAVKDIYGGMSFTISPDVEPGKPPGEARLLPDKSGWEIPLPQSSETIKVTFDPPPVDLYFETGNVREIRAKLLDANSQADRIAVKMTVKLPQGARVKPAESERLAKLDEKRWHNHPLSFTQAPIDLSYLNETERPAGKRGFIRAEGEKFVFEDGHVARFWGTNLNAYALFSSPRQAVAFHAKRIARLGFNLVRIHHHDSKWVDPNIFGAAAGTGDGLSEKSLEDLDWWIKCLTDEGIYIWLDMHVGRRFKASEKIRFFDEIAKNDNGNGVGFSYFNPDVEERMKEFNAAYLGHVNKFTGKAYANDPAVVAVLITNENDLTNHYGNMMLPANGSVKHGEVYMAASREFADKFGLDAEPVWRSWEHGTSKLFLNDREHQFNERMIAHLRSLGVKVPIATMNSWGHMSLASLPSITDGDLVDLHSYGEPNEFEKNPRFEKGMVSWLGAGFVSGKPMTVTEWNVEPFPVFDRATSVPHVSAVAALQDWAAVMQFGYSTGGLARSDGSGNYEAANDPAFLSMLPAAALMFREQHVAPAKKTYLIDLGQRLWAEDISVKTSRALRTIVETSKLRIAMPAVKELPWLKPTAKPADAIIVTDPDFDAVPEGATKLCADTGDFCRDWDTGVFTVDTPRSQLASGWIGGREIALRDVTAKIDTANATVVLQSLDGQDIAASKKLLISFTAQSLTATAYHLPFYSEPVEGSLSIKAQPGLKAAAVLGDGTRSPIEAPYANERYDIKLPANLPAFWIELAP